MRESIRELLEQTECILSTGYAYLFVTDLSKKQYTILFYEDHYKEGYIDISDVILDSEWAIVHSMIDKGDILWDYDDVLDNPTKYHNMLYRIAKKNELNKSSLLSTTLEDELVSVCKQLDKESQKIILTLSNKLKERI